MVAEMREFHQDPDLIIILNKVNELYNFLTSNEEYLGLVETRLKMTSRLNMTYTELDIDSLVNNKFPENSLKYIKIKNLLVLRSKAIQLLKLRDNIMVMIGALMNIFSDGNLRRDIEGSLSNLEKVRILFSLDFEQNLRKIIEGSQALIAQLINDNNDEF
jgi:hypothetical protein